MERRKHKRYRLREGAIAVFSDQLGPIKDIGLGGLAFHYMPFDEKLDAVREVDILMADSASRIQGLPVIPVTDFEIVVEGEDPTFTLRQCSMRFADLEPERKALVSRFIKANLMEETP